MACVDNSAKETFSRGVGKTGPCRAGGAATGSPWMADKAGSAGNRRTREVERAVWAVSRLIAAIIGSDHPVGLQPQDGALAIRGSAALRSLRAAGSGFGRAGAGRLSHEPGERFGQFALDLLGEVFPLCGDHAD